MNIFILIVLISLNISCDKSRGNLEKDKQIWGVEAPVIVKQNGNQLNLQALREFDELEVLDEIKFANRNEDIKLSITTTCGGSVEHNLSDLREKHFIYKYLPKNLISEIDEEELIKCNFFFQAINSEGDIHRFDFGLNIILSKKNIIDFNILEKIKFKNGKTFENINFKDFVLDLSLIHI